MKLQHLLATAAVALAVSVPPVSSAYAASVNIEIGTPPPAVIVETVPSPRAGYVWVNGFWRWDGHRHVWVKGHWVAARHGYHYVPEAWVNVNGRWVFHPGRWMR